MTITFGSLFAGIGGLDLGLERAGMVCKWQVEIDDYATKVLEKHWPDVPKYRDVCEFPTVEGVESVDLICGGFPCQDISYAGKGAGLKGERSGLFYELIRVVREVEPRFVLLENVAAILTRGLDDVLGTLASLGYDAEWHCIPASAVGCIQNRDRAWVIAYPSGYRVQGLFEGKDISPSRQGWSCRQEDLQQVYANPFGGNGWPQPLLRGSNQRVSGWVDRIRTLGNAVVPQVAELIGRRIVEAETE